MWGHFPSIGRRALPLEYATLASIRFGFGRSATATGAANADGLLAELTTASAEPPLFMPSVEAYRSRAVVAAAEMAELQRAARDDPTKRVAVRDYRRTLVQAGRTTLSQRLLQPVVSPNAFYERLVAFWFDHFSVSTAKNLMTAVMVPLFEAEAIRPNVAGSFTTLLTAAVTHPAMLYYLDQATSVGPDSLAVAEGKGKRGINENLGREMIELHTLGAHSGYTQTDVRQAAMVLTGLTVDRKAMEAVYRPRLAQPGDFTVLDRDYGGARRRLADTTDLLSDLAADPRTRQHICLKLASHFVADDPPQSLVGDMAAAWEKSDGDLTEVYKVLLTHPDQLNAPLTKAKRPFEFVVSGLKALDVGSSPLMVGMTEGDDAEAMGGDIMSMMGASDGGDKDDKRRRRLRNLTVAALNRMGQPIWNPSSPAGFGDRAEEWINASQLTERIAWCRNAVQLFGGDRDPRAFVDDVLADAAGDNTRKVVSQAPSRPYGLTLVLASPEFNRR
ncbi:DUF1800 domain-containing protein [Rhizobium sp. PAMB 3182]